MEDFAEKVLERLATFAALLRQLWKDHMHHLQTWCATDLIQVLMPETGALGLYKS